MLVGHPSKAAIELFPGNYKTTDDLERLIQAGLFQHPVDRMPRFDIRIDNEGTAADLGYTIFRDRPSLDV